MKRRTRVLVYPLLAIFLWQSLFPAFTYAADTAETRLSRPGKQPTADELRQTADELNHERGRQAPGRKPPPQAAKRQDMLRSMLPGLAEVPGLPAGQQALLPGQQTPALAALQPDLQKRRQPVASRNARLIAAARTERHERSPQRRKATARHTAHTRVARAPRSTRTARIAQHLRPVLGQLYGLLVDKRTSQPIRRVAVMMEKGNKTIHQQTDDEGRFRFLGIREGQYVLEARTDDYASIPTRVQVHGAKVTRVKVALPSLYRRLATLLEGSVTDAKGHPLAGATVRDTQGHQITTGRSGGFLLETSPGTQTLSITRDGYMPIERTVHPREKVRTGLVPFMLSPVDGQLMRVSARRGGTVTNRDGHIRLVVPPGALDKDTEIRINTYQDARSLPGQVNSDEMLAGVELLPDGLRFRKPARLQVSNAKALHPGQVVSQGFYNPAHRDWVMTLPGRVTPDGKWVECAIEHFTVYVTGQPTPTPTPPFVNPEPSFVPQTAINGYHNPDNGTRIDEMPLTRDPNGANFTSALLHNGNYRAQYELPMIPGLGGMGVKPILTYNSKSRMQSIYLRTDFSPSGPYYSATWTLTLTTPNVYWTGTGTTASVQWDGKDSNGHYVEEGNYAYTVAAKITFNTPSPRPSPSATLNGTAVVLGPGPRYGKGWSFNYGRHLIFEKDSSNNLIAGTVAMDDGGYRRFAYSGSTFTAPPGEYSTLAASGSNYVQTTKLGMVYNYNSTGQLTSIVDQHSNTISLTYTSGLLTSITDSSGKSTTLAYDSNNWLYTITDSASRVWTFTHSTSGNLTRIAGPIATWNYAYDSNGYLSTVTDPRGFAWSYAADPGMNLGAIQMVADPYGYTSQLGYNFVETTDPIPSPSTGPKGVTVDSSGMVWFVESNKHKLSKFDPTATSNQITEYPMPAPSASPEALAIDANGKIWIGAAAANSNKLYKFDPSNSTFSTYTMSGTHNSKQLAIDGGGKVWFTDYSGGKLGKFDPSASPPNQFTFYSPTTANASPEPITIDNGGNIWFFLNNKAKLDKFVPSSSTFTEYNNTSGDGAMALLTDIFGQVWFTEKATNQVGVFIPGSTSFNHYALPTGCTANGNLHGMSVDRQGRFWMPEFNCGKMALFDPMLMTFWEISLSSSAGQPWGIAQDNSGNFFMTLNSTGSTGNRIDQVYIQAPFTEADTYSNNFRTNSLGMTVDVDDAFGNSITKSWDSNANLTEITDQNNNTTTLTYDSKGNLLTATDPLSGVTSYTYSSTCNKVTSMTDPLGQGNSNHTWNYAYTSYCDLYTITDPLGSGHTTTLSYDSYGQLATAQDANSHTVTYTFDSNGNLSTVTDPISGHATTYGYNSKGQRTSVQNGRGKTWTYTFDDLNRPATAADPYSNTWTYAFDYSGNPSSITDAVGNAATTFVFDKKNRMIGMTDPAGKLTQYQYFPNDLLKNETDANTKTTNYSYDVGSRLATVTPPSPFSSNTTNYGYDAVGNLTSVQDGNGHTTHYYYDELNRLIEADDPRADRVHDTVSHINYYIYDDASRLVSFKDGDGHQTYYAYDAVNRLTSVTRPLSSVSYTYDAGGRVTDITDGNSKVTHLTYYDDNLLHVVAPPSPLAAYTTTYAYDAAHNLTSVQDANAHTMSYAYDDASRLYTITDPASNVVTMGYDANNNLHTVQDAKGKTTTYTFDADNRLHIITPPSPFASNTTQYDYDNVGNLSTVTDPNSHATTMAYDAVNRVTSVTRAIDGSHNEQTQFGYDGVGNVTSVTDPNSKVTSYTYYDDNTLHTVALPSASPGTPSATTTYSYDGAQNLTKIQDANNDSSHTTTFTYNGDNMVNRITDPLGRYATFGYDSNHNLTSMTDAKSQSFTYAFDVLNRRTGITSPNDSVSFGYDGVGNLTSASNGTASYSYSYNTDDTMSQKQLTQGGTTKTIGYTWDANGNPATMTDAESVVTTYTFDELNRLTQMANGNYSNNASFSYDAASRMTGMTLFNGVTATYGYDNADRLTSVLNQVPGSPPTTLSSYTYVLDLAGNMTSMTDKNSVATNYTYDPVNRLKQEAVTGGTTTSWTYDKVGNRATQTQGGTTLTYTYDQANQLSSYTDGSNTTSFTYDNNGNTATKTPPGGSPVTYYAYDDFNRLTSQTISSNVYSFTYGPDDLRLSQTDPSSTVQKYLWAQGNVLGEYNSSWSLQNKNTYGLAPDMLLGRMVGSTAYHATTDGLGSVSELTDNSKATQQSYTFDAWGNVSGSGSVNNPFKYTGRENDGTGLNYNRARYYNPALGRFLTPDSSLGSLRNPGSQNRYSYVGDRPLFMVDPSGHIAQPVAKVPAANAPGAAKKKNQPKQGNPQKRKGVIKGTGSFRPGGFGFIHFGLNCRSLLPHKEPKIDRGWDGDCDSDDYPVNYNNVGGFGGKGHPGGPPPDTSPATVGGGPPRVQGGSPAGPAPAGPPPAGPPPVCVGGGGAVAIGGMVMMTARLCIKIPSFFAADSGGDSSGGGGEDQGKEETGNNNNDEDKPPPDGKPDPEKDKLRYDPSPKHQEGGWGTTMDLSDATAQNVLDNSIPGGKQRYGVHNGKVYEFQPDNTGGWHGYPIAGNEAPNKVLRQFLNRGDINRAQYNRIVRGK